MDGLNNCKRYISSSSLEEECEKFIGFNRIWEREGLYGRQQIYQIFLTLHDACSIFLNKILNVFVEGRNIELVSRPELASQYIVLPAAPLIQISPMRYIQQYLQLKWLLMDEGEIDLHSELFVAGEKPTPV